MLDCALSVRSYVVWEHAVHIWMKAKCFQVLEFRLSLVEPMLNFAISPADKGEQQSAPEHPAAAGAEGDS